MADADDLDTSSYLYSTGVSPDSFPITPHAIDPLPRPVRAIRANGAGTVVCLTAASGRLSPVVERTLNFAAGETRYVAITHVRATSTATGLEGMP